MTIKPCPFCGSNSITCHFGKDTKPSRGSYVTCDNCEAVGPFVDSEEREAGIIAWNIRIINNQLHYK